MDPQRDKKTIPSIPAAIRKSHRPTLMLKMNIETQEEEQKAKREVGRYSIVDCNR